MRDNFTETFLEKFNTIATRGAEVAKMSDIAAGILLDLSKMNEESAARTLFAHLRALASAAYMDGDIECSLIEPDADEKYWRVCWDAGPENWGISLSANQDLSAEETNEYAVGSYPPFKVIQSERWYLEPYYSCDVCFVPCFDKKVFDTSKDNGAIENTAQLVGHALVDYYRKNPAELKRIDSRKFEELVAELFRGLGYDVELTKQTRDGGKDVIAVKKVDSVEHRYLIECKRPGPNGSIGVRPVRELIGVLADDPATKAILVTTAPFTADALRLVNRHRWQLDAKSYQDLLNWLAEYHVR